MLNALAERGIRRPRRILIGALVTFVVAAVLGGPVAGQLDSANGFEDPGSSSVAAREAIQQASGLDDCTGGHRGRRHAGRRRKRRRRRERVARRRAGPATAFRGSRSCARRPTRGRALVAARRDSRRWSPRRSRASADEGDVVARATHRLEGVPGVTLGGPAVAGEQIGDQVNSDLGRAELLAFPLLALLAFFFFRGGRAAALPLMVGLLAVVCSFLVIRAHRRLLRPLGLLAERDLRPRPRPGHRLRAVPRVALPRGARRGARRTRCGQGRDGHRRAHGRVQRAHRGRGDALAGRLPAAVPQVDRHRRRGGRPGRRLGGAAHPARAVRADGHEADAARRRAESGRDPLGADHGHGPAASRGRSRRSPPSR